MKLSRFTPSNNNTRCNIGYFSQEGISYFVYEIQGQPHTFFCSSQTEVGHFLADIPFHYQLTQAIPYTHIWKRSFILPELKSELAIAQQAIRILKQHLPLPLEQVHFDYKVTALENNSLSQITLYALKKSDNFAPNTVLDCELHCFLRAIQLLTEIPEEELLHSCYQIQDKFLQYHEQQLTIGTENKTTFPVFDVAQLPQLNGMPHIYHYLIALGASLWNGKTST